MDPEDNGERLADRLRAYRLRNLRNDYSICKFPDSFVGMDEEIQLPKLASFGPCHRGRCQLFDSHKFRLFDTFLNRPQNQGRGERYFKEKLELKKTSIRSCYHDDIRLPHDEELIYMMLVDGCFMIELFLQYEEILTKREDPSTKWEWHVPTLISDLLKLENQLPFFVLMDLSEFIIAPPFLSSLALRFLNQDVVQNPVLVQIQDIKHLLDLFRFSLIPEDTQQNSLRPCSLNSLPNLKQLRRVGINVGRRNVRSLLEIGSQKIQIPPLILKINLKIPSIPIDDFQTILFNCVAMEQRFQNQIKYVTVYLCFLNCLLKEAEDVISLQSVNVISSIGLDAEYFIKLLNILGRRVYFRGQRCYLWKQVEEINTYCNSWLASIRLIFFQYESLILYLAIAQVVLGILSWLG